jgi:hypothetical protein
MESLERNTSISQVGFVQQNEDNIYDYLRHVKDVLHIALFCLHSSEDLIY